MALFSNLKKCDDLRQYNLMYGVTDFSELEQIEHSYAITIHKAQRK